MGPVGSGKSSLLSAFLGEMEKFSGYVTLRVGNHFFSLFIENKWICHLISIVAPSGVKWMYHIHYTGSCIALTFLFIKPATKRDLLVNPIAAGKVVGKL